MNLSFIITTAIVATALAVSANAQQKTNVTFSKGATSSTLKGSIRGDQDHSYIVNARAGQTLTVDFKPTNASAYFNILAPASNGEAMFVGSTSGNNFTGPLAVTGPHVVQVYLMRNAARRNETASYTLTVGVTGGSAAVRPGRDAVVPGTRYNATADISCVTSPGGKPGACKAGVMRKGAGNAVVELQTPDGGQRTITFTGGKATGSNANVNLTATKSGDITTVRIGTSEVYSIPDAFVFGG